MKKGFTFLSNSLFDILISRFSIKHLYFKTSHEKRIKVFEDNSKRLSFYCPECGSLYIENQNIVDNNLYPEIHDIQEGEDTSKIII